MISDLYILYIHKYPDVAQLGRAPALGAGCRMFKSCHLDQFDIHTNNSS